MSVVECLELANFNTVDIMIGFEAVRALVCGVVDQELAVSYNPLGRKSKTQHALHRV